MIFPIRCVTCNAVIGSKYTRPAGTSFPCYLEIVKQYQKDSGQTEMEYLSATTVKTAEGKALDDLNVRRMCCRRHFLGHVDLA